MPNVTNTLLKNFVKLDIVVHVCNPSYSGDGDLGKEQFKDSLGKSLMRLHLNQ
jgi:hypothetical protein